MICSIDRFLQKLKGRDKAMRFVQYFSRFLAFKMLTTDSKSVKGLQLTTFYKAVSLHRKAFRLGMFIDEFLKLKMALADKNEGRKKNLTITLRSLMMFFLVHDNWVWFLSIKVINGSKDSVKKRATYLRFIAAVVNFTLTLLNFQEVTEKLIIQPGDKKTEENQGAHVLGLVKNGCDLMTYGTSTKLFPFLKLDDGQMGIFGSISAIAGGLPIWFKL